MTRARHEASIERLDTTFGREFEKALGRVASRYRGLDFYTDEQVEEIRHEMVRKEWSDHKFRKRQRQQIAAIRAMCETEAV